MMRRRPIPLTGDLLLLVGDVHGATAPLAQMFAAGAAVGTKEVIFLGDVELSISDMIDRVTTDAISDALTQHDLNGWIIAGNHDRAQFIESLPVDREGCHIVSPCLRFLPRTALLQAGGAVLAAAAGAASVDFHRPRETLSDAEYTELIEWASELEVEVLLGHDVPGAGIAGTGLHQALESNATFWSEESIRYASEQNRRFTDMARRLRPRLTCGGHYHFEHISTMDLGRNEPSQVVALGAVGMSPRGAAAAILDLRHTPLIHLLRPNT